MKKMMIVVAMLGLMQVTFAQEEKTDAPKPQNDNLERIQLATALARYGYENYSAAALIQAADILASVQTLALQPASFLPGEGAEGGKEAKPEFGVERLLCDARAYADQDAALLALADRVRMPEGVSRGRVGGASKTVESVKANATDRYKIKFYGDQVAEIFVSGDGDTDLDLYIYDENGNLIDKDDDYTDDCYCRWSPKWTGLFTVKIVNRGNVYNRYTMWTN